MQTSQEKHVHSEPHKHSTPQSELLEITREFNVPAQKVFGAFKTPESIKAWWWPKDLYTDHVDLDFREGGKFFFNMKGYDKGGGGMTGEFQRIIEDKLIVMTDHFADENGRAISAKEAKMPGDWPETIYITLEFESVDEESSRLKLSQVGIPNELQKECIQGWSESFDKLQSLLEDRRS